MAEYGWDGFENLNNALIAVQNPDAEIMPLMERLEAIVVEGNRRGVLAGKDGYNNPMPALQYRNGAGKPTRNRRLPNYGTTKHDATGHGPFASGLHDNLSSAEYRLLTGPRLAPRGEQSRVIKNLYTEVRHDPAINRWEVIGAWDVESATGDHFLIYHFDGLGRNPRYDLRPVRPEDVQFAVNAVKAWAKDVFLARF